MISDSAWMGCGLWAIAIVLAFVLQWLALMVLQGGFLKPRRQPQPPPFPTSVSLSIEELKAQAARWRYLRRFLKVDEIGETAGGVVVWGLIVHGEKLELEIGAHRARYTVEEFVDFAIHKKALEEAQSD